MDMWRKLKKRIGLKKSTKPAATSAAEKMIEIINFINSCGYVSGIEFTNDWKLNYRLFITALANLFGYVIEWYSIYYMYPDLKVVILLGGVAYTSCTSTKFTYVTVYQKKFMSLLNSISSICKENASGIRNQILMGTCKTILKHCRLVLFGIFAGYTVYFFYPCYNLIVNGNVVPISPLKFIFIQNEPMTYIGFFFSTFMNIFLVARNVFGTFALSCIFLTYVDVYDGMVSLVEDDFKMFDRLLDEKGQNVADIRKRTFRNIMIELMDLASYNSYMNELFSLICSAQMASSYAGIVFVLFGYLADGYVGGIGAGTYMFTELMMMCYIGQMMENSTQRLEMVIYNAEWYRYDIKYQKDILLVLPFFQNMQPILIANVYPLNFQTGLKVLKSIYSILMFLVNALD